MQGSEAMDAGFCSEAAAAVPPASLHSVTLLKKTAARPLAGASLSTRALPLSTTKTAPSEVTVRPQGLLRPLSAALAAPVPSTVTMVPLGSTQRRAWFPESTTKA